MKGFIFDLSNITIADVMTSDKYFDTAHTREEALLKKITYKKDSAIHDITLFKEIRKDEDVGCYFLQDLAFSYRKKYDAYSSLLLFVQKIEGSYLLKLVTTSECFDGNKTIELEIKCDEDGEIEKYEINKFKTLISLSDFSIDEIVVFANIDDLTPLFGHLDDLKLYMQKDLKVLTEKEMKGFFDSIEVLKSNKQKINMYLFKAGMVGLVLFGIYVANSMFATDGIIQEKHESKIKRIESKMASTQKKVTKSLKTQELLFLETSKQMKIFISKD